MTLRIEIVPAGRGTAVVETYLGDRRTALSEPLPTAAARLRGEAAAAGGEVIDHTHVRPDDERLALARAAALGRVSFRP